MTSKISEALQKLHELKPELEEHKRGRGRRRRGNGNGGIAPHSRPWLPLCEKDGRGCPVENLASTMLALRIDPIVKDAFAYDEMMRAILLKHSYPKQLPDF